MKQAFFALILLASLTLAFVALGVQQTAVGMHNTGRLKVVGVDCDADHIDWGLVEPNSTTYRAVMFRATGNTPVTLSMYASNFLPANASQYLITDWNYTGVAIVNAWSPVQFSLFVSPQVQNITDFSFDITVIGSG